MAIETMSHQQKGFTLIEMAIVLLIVGMMLSMMLGLTQHTFLMAKRKQVQQDLNEIQQSLMGFVSIHGFLPCPDQNDDGIDDACANTNMSASTEGNLPWSRLGLKRHDPWGRPYRYRLNNALSVPFSLTTLGTGAGQIKICMLADCSRTHASNVALVVYSRAVHDAVALPHLHDELENADGDAVYVSHAPSADGFDDELVWLSYAVLMNRMIILDKLQP